MRYFNFDELVSWPPFKWHEDDKYFARIGDDVLSVYETPSFGFLGKKSVETIGIRAEWRSLSGLGH